MSIKPVSQKVVSDVLKELLQKGGEPNHTKVDEKNMTTQDRFIKLSVNLHRIQNLFDFATKDLAGDPLLISAKCDGDFCDADKGCDSVCDCVCDTVGGGCDSDWKAV